MHVLIALLGILGAAAFWWYRMKTIHDAGREASDFVSTSAKRIKSSQQAHLASLKSVTQIDDPLTAAATLILSIVCEGQGVPKNVETKLRSVLRDLASTERVDAAITEAKRIQAKTSRTAEVIDLLGTKLHGWLEPIERSKLLEMLREVSMASSHRPAHISNHIVRVRDRLEVD